MVVKVLFKFFPFGYLLILILIAGCATTTVDTNKNLDNNKTSASNIIKKQMSKKVNSEEKTSGNDQNDLQIDKKSSEQENQLSESEAFEESKPLALTKDKDAKEQKEQKTGVPELDKIPDEKLIVSEKELPLEKKQVTELQADEKKKSEKPLSKTILTNEKRDYGQQNVGNEFSKGLKDQDEKNSAVQKKSEIKKTDEEKSIILEGNDLESFFSEKQADDKISPVVEMQRERVLSQKHGSSIKSSSLNNSQSEKVGAQNQEKTVFFSDQDENSIPLKQNQSTVGFISDLPVDKFSNGNDLIVSPKQVFLKGQGSESSFQNVQDNGKNKVGFSNFNPDRNIIINDGVPRVAFREAGNLKSNHTDNVRSNSTVLKERKDNLYGNVRSFLDREKKSLKKKDSETLNDFDRTQDFLNQKREKQESKNLRYDEPNTSRFSKTLEWIENRGRVLE